ncbi:MAG: hydroxymethylbilane synthase [Chitinophagaceae bacterium]
METIRLIGRNSRLSLLQIDIAKQKIKDAFPEMKVEVIARSSKGDQLQDIPLHTVEGSDFFTQDIFDALKNDEADIAVHSLKDMSSEHFFGNNRFAVIDRDDTRDVAIFNQSVIEKIKAGQPIIIGTCSPRREEMATVFLKKALPQLHDHIIIETKPIRGNVETRLRKLDSGEYDATILATAGLNRLLRSEKDAPLVKKLLEDKRLMLLPLIECVPAPCQGAVVIETVNNNKKAITVLERINEQKLFNDCIAEKKAAVEYGRGCLQKFGVTTLPYDDRSTLYAAGRDEKEIVFNYWYSMPELSIVQKNFFNSTDHMGQFFEYEAEHNEIKITSPVVYIANYKAVQEKDLVQSLQQRKVWAAGTKTWYELAKQGIWVEGCADAFGLEFLEKAWQMPLTNINKEDVQVITNQQGAFAWKQKGWNTSGTYETKAEQKPELVKQIGNADIIFWTSYQQYQLYKDVLKKNVQHVCPSGETAVLLRTAGLEPIVFPNIKAFQQWKKTSSH